MIYLIYGHQLPVIKKTLKTLVKKCLNGEEANDFNFIRISSRLETVQDIVFECRSFPLCSEKKVVVVSEPYYLAKEKASIEKEQNYVSLIEYIENSSEYTDLIFFLESKDIDLKNDVYKAINKHGTVMQQEVLTEQMLKNMGMAIFTKKNVNISQDALEELVSRCGDDVSKFTLEANKLSLYKDNITIDDVKIMVSNRLENNAFDIVNALLNNKIKKALKIYYDLRINKEEPIRLIALMASQLRFMNQVKYLLNEGNSQEEVAKILKCNPYRIKASLPVLQRVKSKQIIEIIETLYQLDVSLKSGEKDPYFAFELFLINFSSLTKTKD